MQQRFRRNEFRILKVPGTENPADLGTKGVEHAAMLKHMRALGFVSLGGRPTAAPALKSKSSCHHGIREHVSPEMNPVRGIQHFR